MVLVVDCCVRGEKSATKRLYESYLQALGEDTETETVILSEQQISPLTAEGIELREQLMERGELQHEMFRYAKQFKEADEIVVAAPCWNLSFPSLLKVYFEHVAVCGLTFGYEGNRSAGYCRAEKLSYFSTSGRYAGGRNMGAEYVKAFANMLGIREIHSFVIEGLDMEVSKREEVLNQGIRIRRMLQELNVIK